MLIHGGPQGAFGDEFHYRWNAQMFAAGGYVTAMVNFHGSTGYGQAFTDSITGDWGGKPFEDILKGVGYLRGAIRSSTGQARRGRRLLRRLHDRLDRGPHGHLRLPGLPRRRLRSPLHVRRDRGAVVPGMGISRHALDEPGAVHEVVALDVRQELQDAAPRRPQRQRLPRARSSRACSSSPRSSAMGVPSKLLYFPDEDHFISKPQNAELWWKTIHEWLATYLK